MANAPVHLPGSNYPPQRGGGWLNHETEMRDDEWLIKEVRWMTPNDEDGFIGSKQAEHGWFCFAAYQSENIRVTDVDSLISVQLHRTWNLITSVSSRWCRMFLDAFSFAGVLRYQRLSGHSSFLISSRLCFYIHQCEFHHMFSASECWEMKSGWYLSSKQCK